MQSMKTTEVRIMPSIWKQVHELQANATHQQFTSGTRAFIARNRTPQQQENDSNTTNSEEISVEVIRSNGQCCISRELNCQSGSDCDNYMLLSWALMHKLEYCQDLDTSNWKNLLVLNNDTISGSATQNNWLEPRRGKQICLSYSWYILLKASIIDHCSNTTQRAAQNLI